MCYPKPGPRCSAHARQALERAEAAYKADETYENFEKVGEARNEFLSTPAGFKVLEEQYEDSKDPLIKLMLEKHKLKRQKQLRELGAREDEGEPLHNPGLMSEQALSSSLHWDGEKPQWWNEYSQSIKENQFASLVITPKLLDVFDSPVGQVAVVWEDAAQGQRDGFSQAKEGYRVQRCLLKNFETGEQLGYLKVTSIDDDSLKRSFGDDEFSPFRYRSEHSGTGYYYEFNETNASLEKLSPEDLKQQRRKVWLAATRDLNVDITDSEGKFVPSYNLAEKHIPDDAQVQKDLKKYAKMAQKESQRTTKRFEQPFVDFSRMEGAAKGQGFGSAMYIYTARYLATQGKSLRGSGLQTADAQKVWTRFKKRLPDNFRFITMTEPAGQRKRYPLLDFRESTSATQ